jgi:competence/damage-inducible protein CinA-like protein
MNAEILTIGTEILLGEIVDTNTQRIARSLRELGLDLYQTRTVGDNQGRIANAVREALTGAEVVITSGGLGPTIDDETRAGIAAALDRKLEFQPDLWEQIKQRFASFGRTPTENNRRQAHLPGGAAPIPNPIGTAPGFILECDEGTVVALPGVPAELESMLDNSVLPYLRKRSNLKQLMRIRLVRTAGVGESWLDGKIEDLERLRNPTVGLSAHPGRVDIRLTAKAGSESEAEDLLWGLEATLQQRLGDAIYGTDGDELETVTADLMAVRGWKLTIVESGTHGALQSLFEDLSVVYVGGRILPSGTSFQELEGALAEEMLNVDAEAGLALWLSSQDGRMEVQLSMVLPQGKVQKSLSYGGPLEYAGNWAATQAVNQLRLRLLALTHASAV